MNDQEHAKLARYIAKTFYDDPRGYCSAILGYSPDQWQGEVLDSVLRNRRTAVRSGHGVGKTRLAASVIHWFIATRAYPQIVATANTLNQLKEKLWRELAKVNAEAKNKELFEWTATRFSLKAASDRWFASAIPWSEHNPEAFAGTHEENVLMLMDEASAIPEVIWETASGAMTTAGAHWLVLGNPTRNTGRFYECFYKNKFLDGDTEDMGKWHCTTISCVDSPRVERGYIEEQKREYGVDSDFYRVRVLGLPPQQEEQQFISKDLFEGAVNRVVVHNDSAARILGVDVAWYGDDRTILVERKGAEIKKLLTRRGQDTMATVGDVLATIDAARREGRPYLHVVVDSVGIGAGVVDRLKELRVNVIAVNSGTTSRMPDKYKNLRAELWDAYRSWLKTGKIEAEFEDDSCGIYYNFDSGGKLMMERKVDMKSRGLPSPDLADAAVLTFYPASSNIGVQRTAVPRSYSTIRKGNRDDAGWKSMVGLR